MSIAACLAVTGAATACPGALSGQELGGLLPGPRSAQRLFVRPHGATVWRAARLEIDPIDTDGHLRFFPDAAYLSQPIEASDLITLRPEDFGEQIDPRRDVLPCRGSRVVEIEDHEHHRFAYLTSCAQQPWQAAPGGDVRFDRSHHLLESPIYQYRFNPDNYMLFDQIAFRSLSGAWESVANGSQMLIHADVRNFFTMSFDSTEIESHLEESRLGPLGDLARLSFFLRILFFKIQMSLSTDVGFYGDSSHIPMMVSLPVDAFAYLNPGSGILYHWEPAKTAAASPTSIEMPRLDTELVHKGYKALVPIGLRYCKGDECTYGYSVMLNGTRLAMDLAVKRYLVERGFFPFYVEDVGRVAAAMDWDVTVPPGVRRSGMYFEVSGLPKGGHPWDFWMRLGVPGEPAAKRCPAPLLISLVPNGK